MSSNSSIRTTSYGGNGGTVFALQFIKEIGLGLIVTPPILAQPRINSQIRINGVGYGKEGNNSQKSITLTNEEYISKVDIYYNSKLFTINMVSNVKFTTNKGNTVGEGDTMSVTKYSVLENIRVIAIGGRYSNLINKLDIMYVENYDPSVLVESNAGFILSYTSPFQEFYEYTSAVDKITDSYEKITESMLGQTYSASVEGEYFIKIAASTEIKVENTELTTVYKELQKELHTESKKTIAIKEGYVGISLVQGSVMKGSDGKYWIFPTSEPSYSVIKIKNASNVLGHYDLTGELYTQMPELKSYKETKNGFTFYKNN